MVNFDLEDCCNKYTSTYKCPDDIRNLQISVKLQEFAKNEENSTQTETFAWQEKKFAPYEIEFYKDRKNCFTELEKKYHENVKEIQEPSIIFSYVQEDNFIPNDEFFNQETKLAKQMNEMSSTDTDESKSEFNFESSLSNSIKNVCVPNNFQVMHILVDLGEFVDNIWVKSEYLLCTIKYDVRTKNLTVYPDFTRLRPYFLDLQTESSKKYVYFIENVSQKISTDLFLKENTLLEQLTSNELEKRRNVIGDKFELPAKNKLNVYLFLEISTGKNFEYDNIYVQYLINLPRQWSCDDQNLLTGTTQACRTYGYGNKANFGYVFDVCLQCDLVNLGENGFPVSPIIYFEVISKDSWGRFRTEGLTYAILPVCQPGVYTKNLYCYRLSPKSLTTNLRRFFIGDCSAYSDLSWVGIPIDIQESETNIINKFGVDTVATGQLSIKMNVIHQSRAYIVDGTGNDKIARKKVGFEKLKSFALVKSVEQVVLAFKKARRDMIEARKNV